MVEATSKTAPALHPQQRRRSASRDRWPGIRRFFLHPVIQNISIWLLALAPFVLTALNETYPQQALTDILRKILPACIYFALPIYTHGFFLVPLLYKRNYLAYLALFVLNVLLWSALGFYVGDHWIGMRGNNFFIHTVMVGTVTFFGALIKIAKDSIVRNHEDRQAELRLLRAQLNPHFLFNTLNNLYGLAVQKSDRLPPLMLQLSDLLRYSLYETREVKAPLTDEIQYIGNYIELERIRLAERADIEFHVDGETEGRFIAPLLLIVFIENCFKHFNTSPREKGIVRVEIQTKGNTLHFLSCNSKWGDKDKGRSSNSGIGLANVRKRLQLLYPGRHQLHIHDNGDRFEVTLKIDLA